MSTKKLVQPLLALEIFEGLKPLQLTEIVRRAERIVYRPGQVITQAGQAADAAVIVVAGSAVVLGEGSVEEPVVEGSILGELAMLVEHESRATVVARGAVRALRITREALQEQMRDDPALAEHFVDRITRRLTGIAAELQRIDASLSAILSMPKVA